MVSPSYNVEIIYERLGSYENLKVPWNIMQRYYVGMEIQQSGVTEIEGMGLYSHRICIH